MLQRSRTPLTLHSESKGAVCVQAHFWVGVKVYSMTDQFSTESKLATLDLEWSDCGVSFFFPEITTVFLYRV